MRYCEETHEKKDARLYAYRLPNFIVLVAEVVRLKATISSLAESHEKEEPKVDPSQILDFTSIVADVPKIKATIAKQHADTVDKLRLLITTVQQLPKQAPFASKSSEPYILPSMYKKFEEESTANSAVAT